MGGGCSRVNTIFTQQQQVENYHIQSIIGKGGSAVVYRGKTSKKKEVAIKRTVFKTPATIEREIDMTFAELHALKRMGEHPFLPKIHAAFHEKNSCFLILDYLSGGDLRYYLKAHFIFAEHHVAFFISCLGSALNHLHQRGIIHRDLKPENILFTAAGVPKLCDFGTAYVEETYSAPICTLSCGTVPYMAPEMLTPSKLHSYQVDFWSLGITAFELLFNCRPHKRCCPKRLIGFSAHRYHRLWETLRFPAAPDGVVDFESLDQTTSSENHEMLSFPDSTSSLLFDGERLHLTTPIPLITYGGEIVSRDCFQLLQSLLDVRIPQRLGQLSRFHLFSDHSWFQRHHCVAQTTLAPPPLSSFQPNSAVLESHLRTKYRHDPLLQQPCSSGEGDGEPLPEPFETRLQSYFYLPSPHSSPSAQLAPITGKPQASLFPTTLSSESSGEHPPRNLRS
jgi:serine/threonine protein kinase